MAENRPAIAYASPSARCTNFDQSSLMIVLCVGVALAQVGSGSPRLSSSTTLQRPRARDRVAAVALASLLHVSLRPFSVR
eukprot:6354654-Pyramimonas_sp.AAC.1